MNGYVQDKRYTAGAGMRTTAGMQEVEPRRSSCRGAVPLSFAQRFLISMGAEVAQYLTSGLAVKHPCALILDFLSRKVLK